MATITLKNIPYQLHQKLKKQAQAHHRSLNSEIIVSLERAVMEQPIQTDSILKEARQLRKKISYIPITDDELKKFKNQGRS